MEPPCGQSIVKCEKQKDDGRMETQKRKQNEKEKAERRMKIVAGLGSVDEYIPYVRQEQTSCSADMCHITGQKNTEPYFH